MKPPFSNFKSVVIRLFLAGFIFASGFIAGKTLPPAGTSIESSGGRTVSSSSGNAGVTLSSTEAGVSSGGPSVNAGNPSVTVWVNTKSGVYHCPNTRWYGNTKEGKYMTQQEARSKGYRPAHGTLCG